MSCVVSGVATLNAAGLSDDFAALWAAAWYKSWIVAFPNLVVAPLTAALLHALRAGNPANDQSPHQNASS